MFHLDCLVGEVSVFVREIRRSVDVGGEAKVAFFVEDQERFTVYYDAVHSDIKFTAID